MIRLIIISLLALHLAGEAWILFGPRSGKMLVVFCDGKTHGVTLWWFIKGITDAALIIGYCAAGVVLALRAGYKPLARFILFFICYHTVNLSIWLYNYSTVRWVFYILFTPALVYGISILKTKKLKAV